MKVQARITLPPEVRREIDRLRLACNPERATGNPAHITIAYQDEAPSPTILIERMRLAAARTRPFRLVVGPVARFPAPTVGAFLVVTDPTAGVASVREMVLTSPFTRRDRFGLHITLLHPDHGERLEAWWPSFIELPPVGEFEVTEIEIVGPDNALLAVFPLARHAESPDPRLT